MSHNPFVRAVWSDLVVLTYTVPDDVLAPHLGDLELDRWNGSACISIVAFQFSQARIFGMIDPLLPSVRSFAQWNLRAYVRHAGKPGIVFLKEFVPSRLVAGVVRAVYKENYHQAPVRRSTAGQTHNVQAVAYHVDCGGRTHSMSIRSKSPAAAPARGSLHHFAVERYTGYPAGHRNIHFLVDHRPWLAYPVSSYVLGIDYRLLYGDRWAFLNDKSPDAVTWCDGSPVDVLWRQRG